MDMDFYLVIYYSYMFKTLGYWINYIENNKNPLNEWNVILICYVMEFF
jgi:hypothetical protein